MAASARTPVRTHSWSGSQHHAFSLACRNTDWCNADFDFFDRLREPGPSAWKLALLQTGPVDNFLRRH